MDKIDNAIAEHLQVIGNLKSLQKEIELVAQKLTSCIDGGGKIFWMGNGGSAADSQHLAAELVGRFCRERRGLPSIALTTDTSIITSVANDYHYERIFERQIEALAGPADVVIGISTSGKSKNVLLGVEKAKEKGALTIGLTGNDGGVLKNKVDICLNIPCKITSRIQEAHILIGHIICDLIETKIIENDI